MRRPQAESTLETWSVACYILLRLVEFARSRRVRGDFGFYTLATCGVTGLEGKLSIRDAQGERKSPGGNSATLFVSRFRDPHLEFIVHISNLFRISIFDFRICGSAA
jgi:hypothetical protein